MDPETTQTLIEVINETYTDKVDRILSYRIEDNDDIVAIAQDGRKQLGIRITSTTIQIKLLNPKAIDPGKATFAEPEAGDTVDRFAEAAAAASGPLVDGWLNQIKALLDESGDLVGFAERLEQVYPDLDGSRVTSIVQDAMLASSLAGAAEDEV